MMVESFLPAMRELTAKRLHAEGYSQGKVATLLGVTQASVSLYLKSNKSAGFLERLGISGEQSELYASLLAEDLKKSPVYAVNTLYSMWSDALGRGSLCSAHRSDYPALAECSMCLVRFGASTSPGKDAIEQVAEAVSMLESSTVFVKVMPEVSVNIAYAPEGATSVKDVVAVPGRIVKVKGAPRSFMRPEYGASTHVASVLLSVLSSKGSKRAAMNIRFDDKVRAAVKKMGLNSLQVKAGRPVIESLTESSRAERGSADAIIDPGGPGTEAGLYLFAENPKAVAELGLKIARAYSSS